MDRRLKLGLISITDVVEHGKDLEKAIQEVMPEGTTILMKENDYGTASLKVILHNAEWEEVPCGEHLEVVLVRPQAPEVKTKLIYNH
jgi:hypothetical protein